MEAQNRGISILLEAQQVGQHNKIIWVLTVIKINRIFNLTPDQMQVQKAHIRVVSIQNLNLDHLLNQERETTCQVRKVEQKKVIYWMAIALILQNSMKMIMSMIHHQRKIRKRRARAQKLQRNNHQEYQKKNRMTHSYLIAAD